MRKRKQKVGGLDPKQRRIVLAVSIAAVLLLTMSSSFNYMLKDMLADLDATDSQTDMARQIPSIAALLVIFVAGIVGEKLGARRVMLVATALYAIGSIVVAIAPVMAVATFGLLLANVGKSALFVVGLAYMSSSITNRDGRASAFATFSAVMPITYLLMPIIAGLILANSSWRLVAVVWAVSGIAGTLAVWKLLPKERADSGGTGEMLTPALAGVVLAVLVQVVTILPDNGMTTRLAITIAIGVIAAVVLVVAMKRMAHPSLSLQPLRHGGLVLLLVVLILTLFANLWFYMEMALQYIFGLSALEAAIAMMPVQLFSVAGAAISGKLVKRKGIAVAGGSLLVVVAVALGASSLIELTTPIWVCIAIVSVYSAAAVGAGVALTNAIMDLARDGDDGAASAYRGAASNLGSAIGVALMTGIVFSAASTSLYNQSVAAGIDPSTSSEIAEAMKDGATSEDASSLYAVPVAEADQIDDMRRQAYVDGLQAQGLAGGAVTLVAAGMFYLVRRRQEVAVVADREDAKDHSGG